MVERTADGSKKVACEESKCAMAGAVAVAAVVMIGDSGGGGVEGGGDGDGDTDVLKKGDDEQVAEGRDG